MERRVLSCVKQGYLWRWECVRACVTTSNFVVLGSEEGEVDIYATAKPVVPTCP